ncbi:transcription/translation regulatory transformer protein RfaH [Shewanella marina]|uniref:transcription/translation regulatory transformer protein RfaH n=1 Tax=Shewanella marina TaxID=487319 RepID=UPI00046F791C|nr:transcription/translation regulatory transformer protein RfaH [Shewanella marina]
MKGWYLVHCKPKSEFRAKMNLEMQQIETYLPSIKLKKGDSYSTAPLFPNYLFIFFHPEQVSVRSIHSTRGVASIVGCCERMRPLSSKLIETIKVQEQRACQAMLESVVPADEQHTFATGDKVSIKEGPFAALEGIYQQKSGTKRCHILLSLMGREQSIEVPITVLNKSH